MDLSDPQGVVKLGDWLDNPLCLVLEKVDS